MSKGLKLLLDSNRGQYIPQQAIECLADGWDTGISNLDLAALKQGPENDWYYDAFDALEQNAQYTDDNGNVWRLHLDGDLWAFCETLMTEQEKADFFGNDY